MLIGTASTQSELFAHTYREVCKPSLDFQKWVSESANVKCSSHTSSIFASTGVGFTLVKLITFSSQPLKKFQFMKKTYLVKFELDDLNF